MASFLFGARGSSKFGQKAMVLYLSKITDHSFSTITLVPFATTPIMFPWKVM